MKKILNISIIVLTLFGCDVQDEKLYSIDLQKSGTRSTLSGYIQEGNADNQLLANKYCTMIINHIVRKDGSYPDFWGGAYTDEKGLLYILTKGNLQSGKLIVRSIINDDIIRYVPCRYSYQELVDILHTINKKLKSQPHTILDNICAYFLEDSENRVIVELEDNNPDFINLFKDNIINHEAIVFRKGAKEKERNSQIFKDPLFSPKTLVTYFFISPGSQLSNNRENYDDYNGSWGFPCRDMYDTLKVGMVTAAHVIPHDSAFYHSTYMGQASVLYHTDDVDAAFVEFQNSLHHKFIPSPFLTVEDVNGPYTEHTEIVELSREANLPLYGTTVNKRGWTTGLTTGTIESTVYYPAPVLLSPNTLPSEGFTRASFQVNFGDSGGIVYTYYSSINKRYNTGVISGRIINSQQEIIGGYFSKTPLIVSTLGIEL